MSKPTPVLAARVTRRAFRVRAQDPRPVPGCTDAADEIAAPWQMLACIATLDEALGWIQVAPAVAA